MVCFTPAEVLLAPSVRACNKDLARRFLRNTSCLLSLLSAGRILLNSIISIYTRAHSSSALAVSQLDNNK